MVEQPKFKIKCHSSLFKHDQSSGYLSSQFPPNNWENQCRKQKQFGQYIRRDKWKTKRLDSLDPGASKTYHYSELHKRINAKEQPLIVLQ